MCNHSHLGWNQQCFLIFLHGIYSLAAPPALASALLYWKVPMGFPGNSAGKESACSTGDPSSIPGSGRSPGEGIGYPLHYSWASLMAQLVKNLPAMWETWVRSLGWEDPLEKGMATYSSILAWRIHGLCSPWGRKESGTTEQLSLYFNSHWSSTVVLRLGCSSELSGRLLKTQIAGSTPPPRIFDGLEHESLHFLYASMWYWCYFSEDHLLRTIICSFQTCISESTG